MTLLAAPNRAPRQDSPHWRSANPSLPTGQLARSLGWFSIGLGIAELFAPEKVGAAVGVRHPALIRAYGLREIVTGIGILSCNRPTNWMWGRVAGDALDLATLATAMTADERDARRAAVGAAAVAGVMAIDAVTAAEMSGEE